MSPCPCAAQHLIRDAPLLLACLPEQTLLGVNGGFTHNLEVLEQQITCCPLGKN